KTSAPEIIHRGRGRPARPDFAKRPEKINLPPKRRPAESACRSLNRLGEIAAAICQGRQPHFVLHPNSARQRFLATRGENPGPACDEQDEAYQTKDDWNRKVSPQLRGTAQSEAQKEEGGKCGADAMRGDIHHPVEREQQSRDQGRDAKTLVGPFAQRKNPPNKKRDA